MPRKLALNRPGEKDGTWTWVDLDLREPDHMEWVANQTNLPAHLVEHLRQLPEFSQRETLGHGLLICFRDRIRDPSDGNQDDPFIRMWIERDRVITARTAQSAGCDTLFDVASQDSDSWSPWDIFSFLVRKQLARLEPRISAIVRQIGDLEDQFLEGEEDVAGQNLGGVGRNTMRIRRHFIELRELLKFVQIDESLELSERERSQLVTAQNHLQSFLEGLDDCRERVLLLQSQIDARRADRLNQNALRMTILATVFLPLSFLTGLLGMNVAGIPDEHNPWGFVIVCAIMAVIAVVSWVFLTKRWT